MAGKDPLECLRKGDADYFRGIDLEFLQNYRILALDETCLSEAVAEGQLEVCQVIYERCPQHLYSVNKNGNTIFHHLAFYKNATTTMSEYFIHLLAKAEEDEGVESEFRMKPWLQRKNNDGLTAFNRSLRSDNITLMIQYWMQVDREYNLEMLGIPDAKGNTALHRFVQLMHLKHVELLLTAEPAPVYEKNNAGEIPLWIAMRRALTTGNSNAVDIRRLILEKLPAQSTIPIGDNKRIALHQATYTCDLGAIADIVRFCPSCIEIEDANGQNFLQIALQSGHLSQVMHVLYRNNIVLQRPLATIDQKKNTLMHLAVMQNELELVKWLMPRECHIKYSTNTDEETPLLIAMRQSISSESITDRSISGKMRKYLLEMNPTQGMICTTSKNWTPLQNAAHNGDTNSFNDIIKFCPDSMHVVDVQGRNFLHTAFLNGKFDLFFHALRTDNILTTLLSQNDIYGKSPLGLTDDNMNTPFHLAVKQEDLQSVKKLSDASSNIPYGINSDGETPLGIAMRQAHQGENTISVHIRKLILEKHPNQSRVRTGHNKWTSLHHSASLGETDVVRDILRRCPNCAEIVDTEGRNFLHIAAEFKQYDVVKYVCDSNVIPSTILNQLDRYGHTPLHTAAKTGIRDVILCLLYNSDVDKTTTNASGQKVLDAINFDYDKESAGVYGVRDRMNDRELKEQSDFDLVVGALIATVSFTAGITVPGGYINDGPNSGLALLANHAAFEVFAIANNLALVFSLYAVFSHFCTRHLLRREDIIYQLNVATLCTLAAIFSMMAAFIAGSYAVLVISKRIAITVSVTSACFFLFAIRAICRIVSQHKKSSLWKYCGFSSRRAPDKDSNSTSLYTMPL